MGQLKEQLAGVLRYGFWIGAGFVAIVSIAVWYMSTSSLQAEADSQQSKIKSAFTSVTSLQSELSTHPNEKSHEMMRALIETREEEVLEAWTEMYARQRSLLTWPLELQQDFVDEFKDLIPIERYVQYPPEEGQEKEAFLLNRYRYYIGLILPEIATIARAKWTAQFDPTFSPSLDDQSGIRNLMAPRINISGTKNEPLVVWSDGSQQQLLMDLFPWRGSRPSTLQVYYSQENVWILKQILQIIDTVNIDAKEAFEAKIREIKTIKIGRSVNVSPGILKQVSSQTAGMGMDGMGMDDMGMGMDSMGMDSMGMDSMGGDMGVMTDPGDNRYVGTDYVPITGSALRSALDSDSPSDVNLAVAKRVPVMMAVRMDQRSVPDLIAACGSAPLMIEVKQVRLLPAGASSAAAGGGDGMGGMDSMDGGGGGGGGFGAPSGGGFGAGESAGMDSMDGGMGGMGGGAMMTEQGPATENPYDIDVEVYGLIYIYNPPNKAKLGVDQVDQETVVEGLVGDKPTTTTDSLPTPTVGADGTPKPPVVPETATPPAAVEPSPPATNQPNGTTPPATVPPATAPPAAADPNAAAAATVPAAAPPG